MRIYTEDRTLFKMQTWTVFAVLVLSLSCLIVNAEDSSSTSTISTSSKPNTPNHYSASDSLSSSTTSTTTRNPHAKPDNVAEYDSDENKGDKDHTITPKSHQNKQNVKNEQNRITTTPTPEQCQSVSRRRLQSGGKGPSGSESDSSSRGSRKDRRRLRKACKKQRKEQQKLQEQQQQQDKDEKLPDSVNPGSSTDSDVKTE